MSIPWTVDLMWWVTAVELPALGGLLWLLWRTRQDTDTRTGAVREALADYKLEVARTHVSMATLKDVENRLRAHLERIELKLDAVQVRSLGRGAAPWSG